MTGTVLEEGLRGAGGHLLNGAMHRFMGDYDPKLERATRDVVSRAIYAEMRAGRTTPNGGVYIEMGHLGPDNVRKQFKGMVERCADCGFDLAGGLVEVVPTAHYLMGGVVCGADYRDELAGPVRRRRGRQRRARRQPAGRQRRRQLDGVRRHRRRRDAALDRRQSAAAARPTRRCSTRELARALAAVQRKARRPRTAARTAARRDVGRCRHHARPRGHRPRARARSTPSRPSCLATGVPDDGRAFNMTWHDWLNLRSLIEISRVIALRRAQRARIQPRRAFPRGFPRAGRPRDLAPSRSPGRRRQA